MLVMFSGHSFIPVVLEGFLLCSMYLSVLYREDTLKEQVLSEHITFLIHFLQLYCPNGISSVGNSGCLPWGKPAVTESCYLTCGACWVF